MVKPMEVPNGYIAQTNRCVQVVIHVQLHDSPVMAVIGLFEIELQLLAPWKGLVKLCLFWERVYASDRTSSKRHTNPLLKDVFCS